MTVTETNRVYVLGVDPGTTTGLALDVVQLADDRRSIGKFWSDQLGWHEAAAEVRRWLLEMSILRGQPGCRVLAVGEKFVINAKTHQRGQEYIRDATGMLGVLREHCGIHRVRLEQGQQASDVKSLVTDTVLRGLGLYERGSKHVNDAHRHAVAAAHKAGLLTARDLFDAATDGRHLA